MSKITQYSRLSHHTLSGSASATFSVPPSEDFTDGTWNVNGTELALSEIGVNEDSKKAYIRINDEIKEFEFVGGTAGAENLTDTLSVGNTTGGNDIVISVDDLIKGGGSASISLGTTARPNEVGIYTENVLFTHLLEISPGASVQTITDLSTTNLSTIQSNPDAYTIVINESALGITDTFNINPQIGITGIISDDITTGNSTTTNHTPNNIISTATDVASTITDTIKLDPQGLTGGTGITSINTTTGIYSQTTHTPDNIILASVDGAGETSQINIHNGGGQGVEITSGDANIYSTINITSLYTTLALNDIPNNHVDLITLNGVGQGVEITSGDANIYSTTNITSLYTTLALNDIPNNHVDLITLDTGNTGITSEDTLSGNIAQSIYTPHNIVSYATDVSLTRIDTISVDPSTYTTKTGISSEDITTGNIAQSIYTPDNIISSATDVVNTITDTFYLDPQGLTVLGGSGILSDDGTTNSTLIVMPSQIQLNNTDGSSYNNNLSIASGVSPGIQLGSSNITTSDNSQIDLSDTNVVITSNDATGQKVDNLYIDPQGLSTNETGIKSKNQVSLDNVYVSVNSSTMIGRLFVDETSTGVQSSVIVDNLQAKIQSTDGGSSIQAVIVDNVGKQINLSTQTWNDIGNGKITMTSNGIISNNISFERASTANNTITTIHTFQCVNSGPKSYKVRVTGVKTDYTKAYLSEMFGLYLFDGTTVTLVGTLDKVEKTNFSTATSTISISGTTIIVRVTGEAATNIDWEVYVEMNTTD